MRGQLDVLGLEYKRLQEQFDQVNMSKDSSIVAMDLEIQRENEFLS